MVGTVGITLPFLTFVSMIERQKPLTERLFGDTLQMDISSSSREFLRKLERHVDPETPSGLKVLTGSDHRYYGRVGTEGFDLKMARLTRNRNRPYGSFRGTFSGNRLSIEVNSFSKTLFIPILLGPVVFMLIVLSMTEIRESFFQLDTPLGWALPLFMVLIVLGSPLMTIYFNRNRLAKTVRQELTEIDREP